MRDRSRLFRLTLAVAVAVITSTLIAPVQPASAAEGDLATETLVAAGDVWSYYDNGTDPGGTWNQPTYDDTPWQTGNGQFGYGDGDETTLINYGPDPQNKYATTYFRKTLNLTNTHQLINATATLTYDDGAIIYLNGTQIHHTGNIPNNHTHQTWANQNREETITIPLNPNLLTNGQNTIAVEIHQAWRKSNDISFDLTIEATRNDDPAPPAVNDDRAETEEGFPANGYFSENDDPNLTYTIDSILDPSIGIFVTHPSGSWILTPAPLFIGDVVIDHTGCDAAGVCASAQLTITVKHRGDVSVETLIPAGGAWSFLDDGTDPGGTWNQPTYDDTPWQTGNGQFGYGDGDETTLINYGPDPQNKYATTYFRKTLNLTNTHQLINATATLTYDDGAIIYLNGTQIHHTGNIPNNHTHQTWANQNREETITIPLNPNLLTNGQNTIAVEIHQAWRKSNDISFDLTIEATRQILGGLQAPTVVNDEAEAFAERELLGTVAANDRANDAGALTWYVESNDRPDPPTVGTLTFSNDGTYRFTSAADFLGTVVVPYEACNGGACDFGTLTITVEANNYVTRSLGLLAPVHIVDPGPIDLVVGEAIDVAIDYQVTDGIFSYEWLSPGLTGTVDGHISGTPTEAGSNTAHITLVDLAGNRVEALVLLTVRAGAPTGDPTEHPAIDATTLEVRPEQNQHGVIGLNLNDSTVADVRVWDMQQLGNHMYLGGEFQQVQLGDDGAVIDQAFLARFNLATGHYDPTFTPDLDGNVHALEVSPNGLLLVGGEFTSIDGVVNSAAIAAINPATGAVDTGFRTSMERPWSSNEPVIRELEVVGDLLYVTGNFSHLRDRLTNKRERVYKLARLNAATGEADLTWRPRVTGGSVYGLAIDQDRGRVMLTGSFTSVDGIASTAKLALIDTVIGDVIGDTMPDTAWKIFDIEYANDMIFLANGWNNQISVHDADTFEVIHHYESDGDFQFIEKVGDNVYAGCHCTQDPSFPTARVLSAVTGLELDLQFDIGGNIDGAWSVATDSLGCVWIGGDILDGGFDGARVWARGFARFCQQDQPANPGLGGAL